MTGNVQLYCLWRACSLPQMGAHLGTIGVEVKSDLAATRGNAREAIA